MKKYFVFSLLILFCLSASNCAKKKESNNGTSENQYAQTLKSRQWTLYAATIYPALTFFTGTYTNLFTAMETCGRTATLKFNSDGSAVMTNGCTTITGTWSVNSSGDILTMKKGGVTYSYQIITLTSSMLSMSVQLNINGSNYAMMESYD